MKKLLVALSIVMLAASAAGQSALDPHSRFKLKGMPAASRSGQRQLAAIVRAEPGADFSGVDVDNLGGAIYVVRGTAAEIEELATREGVQRVSLARELMPANDLVAKGMRADAIAKLPEAEGYSYTGKGVITGLFDTGFDLQNPAFRADGHSRVKRLWHYTSDNGEYTEYTLPPMLDAFITEDSEKWHGTHVLGTMAGNYPGGKYQGIAPGADIAVACGDLYDANIADGVARIAAYARSEGKPCVINLSIADFLGPRDGSDAFSEALHEATVAAGDAILVISAGNYRHLKTSVSRTLSSDDPAVRTFFLPAMWKRTAEGAVSVWSGDNRPFSLTLVIMDTVSEEVLATYKVPLGEEGIMLGTDDLEGYEEYDYTVDEAFCRAYDNSYAAAFHDPEASSAGRQCYYIPFKFDLDRINNQKGRIALGIVAEGEPGQRIDIAMGDLSAELRSLWVDGWTEGDGALSISSMACTREAVSVGAWVTRTAWEGVDCTLLDTSDTHRADDIAPWSSCGVQADGKPQPFVAAPGAVVLSCYSTPYAETHPDDHRTVAVDERDGRRNYWTWEYGTSMSSPAVAGAIALWLEADPNLEAAEVLDIIKKTAVNDSFTEADPLAFGAGKFDAAAGLREVLARKASLAGSSAVTPGLLTLRRNGDSLEVEIAGHGGFAATIHDLAGRAVAHAASEGGIATLSTASLAPGVYIVSAAGQAAKVRI